MATATAMAMATAMATAMAIVMAMTMSPCLLAKVFFENLARKRNYDVLMLYFLNVEAILPSTTAPMAASTMVGSAAKS